MTKLAVSLGREPVEIIKPSYDEYLKVLNLILDHGVKDMIELIEFVDESHLAWLRYIGLLPEYNPRGLNPTFNTEMLTTFREKVKESFFDSLG